MASGGVVGTVDSCSMWSVAQRMHHIAAPLLLALAVCLHDNV